MLTISRHALFILVDLFLVLWLAVLVISRKEAERARQAERAKYGRWDDAYKEAVGEGKIEYYAVRTAVKAVDGGENILKVWDETYNKAIAKGVRKYRAGKMATAAARKMAHGD